GLFSTMKLAHDTRYVTLKEKENIIYIPVEDISSTDFSRSNTQNNEMVTVGYHITKEFLENWPR
ncbi:MAG TPA: hypothetical protein VK142_06180, partial [Bacillota bacterium]|nr:hypothetical protein [Bacillota bacterium]